MAQLDAARMETNREKADVTAPCIPVPKPATPRAIRPIMIVYSTAVTPASLSLRRGAQGSFGCFLIGFITFAASDS